MWLELLPNLVQTFQIVCLKNVDLLLKVAVKDIPSTEVNAFVHHGRGGAIGNCSPKSLSPYGKQSKEVGQGIGTANARCEKLLASQCHECL